MWGLLPGGERASSRPGATFDCGVGQHTHLVSHDEPSSAARLSAGGAVRLRRCGQQEPSGSAAAAVVHPAGARQIRLYSTSSGSKTAASFGAAVRSVDSSARRLRMAA